MTLIHSTLAALPNYVMQTVPLPKTICDELDSICQEFLWGGSGDSKKIHLVKWSELYGIKADGGLGMRPSHLVIEAYMIKLG